MSINELIIYIKTPHGFFVFIGILISLIGLFLRKYMIKKIKSGDNSVNIQSKSIKIKGDVVGGDKINIKGGDVVGRDKNIIMGTSFNTMPSNLEKMTLKYLCLKRIKDGLSPRDKLGIIFSKLEIKEGDSVSTLNDSEYLKIKGDDVMMTPTGIRYMDNLPESEKAKIILPEEKRALDEMFEKQRQKMNRNRINSYKNSAK